MRFLLVLGRGVAAHQYLIADYQAGVDDFAAPFGGHVSGSGRAFVGEHSLNFAAERFCIKFERFLTSAIEKKVRIYLHDRFPEFGFEILLR